MERKQTYKKNTRESTAILTTTKMSRKSKIHFSWTDDAVASFIMSPMQMQMSIWRSELGVDSFKIWTNKKKNCWVLSKNQWRK